MSEYTLEYLQAIRDLLDSAIGSKEIIIDITNSLPKKRKELDTLQERFDKLQIRIDKLEMNEPENPDTVKYADWERRYENAQEKYDTLEEEISDLEYEIDCMEEDLIYNSKHIKESLRMIGIEKEDIEEKGE